MRSLLLTLLVGCASSTPPPSSQLARPPFTAAQIRDATQAGRTYVWKLTAEGRSFRRRLKFVEVDAEQATTEAVNLLDDGNPLGETELKTQTWDDFVKHAAWPKDGTTITDDHITVGAGEFDCMLYTIDEQKEGQHVVTRAWFAKNLPGAPVKMIVEVDGKQVTELELLEHSAGG